MIKDLEGFLKKFNIKPKNIKLFYQALTHPTYSNEKRSALNYQRLEFLGDAILTKLSAEKTFHTYPNIDEGQLTIIKSNSVRGETLSNFSKKIGLNKFILIGKTRENLKNNKKILEDVFEAFIAAIYLDQGEEKVKEFLKDKVFEFIVKAKNKTLKNPKTILQEYLQSESREIIRYETVEISEEFVSEVFHDNISFGKGKGKTKKEAEINAAKNALKLIGRENN